MPHPTVNIEKKTEHRRGSRPARADGLDVISPEFGKLMLELRRLPGSTAEKAAEIAAHLKLYHWLVNTQGKRYADETVEQITAYYRFRRQHPEMWKAYADEAARRSR
jgi:hypothetical protein